MVVVSSAAKSRQSQYSATVVEYFRNNGHIIALSDDMTFMTLLRLTLTKELGIQQSDCLTMLSDPALLLRNIKDTYKRHAPPVIFLERSINGQDLSFMVKQFKEAFPDVRVIVLTITAEKARLMLLHEVGADNFIAKPVSTNTLIEKLAFTLRPQSKLGQTIDAAKIALSEGRPKDALKMCDEIMRIKPNSAAGFLVQGDAFLALGVRDKAREAYEAASKNADLYLEPLHRLVHFYKATDDIENQLAYLRRLDSLSPLNVERKVDMGEIHLKMDDPETAKRLFDQAVAQVSRDAMSTISAVASRIASIYADKDPEQAETYLRKCLEAKANFLSPEDVATYNQLGLTLRHQGRWEDALVEYKKALKLAPSDENLFYNMGMACAEGKDFRAACIHMSKALDLNSNLPYTSGVIAYNLGIVFLRGNLKERAKRCLEIALELNPSNANAQRALTSISA